MRSPATAFRVFRAFLLLAGLCAAAPAFATTQIFGNVRASLSGDVGFEGLYRYDVDVIWTIDPPDMNRADIFVQLEALDDSCGCTVVRFDDPAGTSDGLTCLDGSCTVNYRGHFFCTSDAISPFPNHGAAARFKPIESTCGDTPDPIDPDPCVPGSNFLFLRQQSLEKCTMGNQGTGHFVFYSSSPPTLPSLHANALSFSHGDRIEFGNLFGSLPGGTGAGGLTAPPPVVINEFLVKPPPGQSEFIEVFNTTGGPIDIGGWRLIVTNGTYESDFTFPDGTSLPSGGFAVDSTATTICDVCLLSPRPGIGTASRIPQAPPRPAARGVRPQFAGQDFLFDQGGVIQLEDTSGTQIDRVGYGNLGGAPVSCPLVVPAGQTPPPGFGGGGAAIRPQAAGPETLSVSTSRAPDGANTGTDQTNFNVSPPTPDASNTVATPNLGGSIRISKAYLFPRNDDADPKNESVSFFNPTTDIVDLQNLSLSDGTLIQTFIQTDHSVPLEPGEELNFYAGLNATTVFEFGAEDRMDVYISTPNGLVRVDQLGWLQIPDYFPDSCLVRVPEATGPAGGWDWATSGGDVNLFYEQCNLEAPVTSVMRRVPAAQVALGAASPNPAHGDVAFEITVGGTSATPVLAKIGIFDVAGRLVRYVGTGFYTPGRYRAVWDGSDLNGASTSPGIYFARVLIGNEPTGTSRPVVRVRG
jgi:hypothetical protein